MVGFLRIKEDKLIDMFSTPSIIKKINNANYKRYVNDKLEKKFEEDPHHVKTILDPLKLERLGKIKAEDSDDDKTLEGYKDQTVNLSTMQQLEGDEEVKK